MANYPYVSVVITACDRPILFRRAFESVIESAGNFGLNIEVIVVNDGKHLLDISTEITENLKIKYIQSPNGPYAGVARARNYAIDIAQGEYILFLDDDDALNEKSIGFLYQKAALENLDLVYGNVELIRETQDLQIIRKSIHRVANRHFSSIKVVNFICVGSFIIKRNVIVSKFDEHLSSHEDWEFLIANTQGINIASLDKNVVKIFSCKTRENRNPEFNALKTYNNHVLVYERYPDSDLIERRERFLKKISIKKDNCVKTVTDCKQMELLLINTNETIQKSLISSHKFEIFTPKLALTLLENSGLAGDVVDVGAFIGSFAVPVANAVSKNDADTRIVHCFECQKVVFLHLCSHVLINQVQDQIYPYHEALSDKVEDVNVPQVNPFKERHTASVSLNKDVISVRTNMKNIAEPDTTCDVYQTMKTSTLDMHFSNQSIALIKLSAGGMESTILRGGTKVIEQSRPFILSESWGVVEFKALRDELMALLESLNYILYYRKNDIAAIPKERLTPELELSVKSFQYTEI